MEYFVYIEILCNISWHFTTIHYSYSFILQCSCYIEYVMPSLLVSFCWGFFSFEALRVTRGYLTLERLVYAFVYFFIFMWRDEICLSFSCVTLLLFFWFFCFSVGGLLSFSEVFLCFLFVFSIRLLSFRRSFLDYLTLSLLDSASLVFFDSFILFLIW